MKIVKPLSAEGISGWPIPGPDMKTRVGIPAKRLFLRIVPLLLILALWQALATGIWFFRSVPFPTPAVTLQRLTEALMGRELMDHSIYRHTLDSLWRWAYGFFAASTGGVLFGLAAGWWRALDRLTSPVVQVLQLIPGLAWIPVALLLFGVGENATCFMIAVTAFAPVAINVTDGVKQVDTRYIRAAQMMGASGKVLFLRVLLPGALPQIISGLRVGLGNSWRVVVAAEMVVGTGSGLGYAIVQSRWSMDYTASFACIIVIAMIGLLVDHVLFRRLEKLTIRRWGLHGRDI
ncbi:MAG: ABC transporter permease [Pseudomonadota bacterium]